MYVNQPLLEMILSDYPPTVLMRGSRKAGSRYEFLAKRVLAKPAEEQRFFYFGKWMLVCQSAAIRDDTKRLPTHSSDEGFSQSGFSQRPQWNRDFFILESGCLYVNQPLLGMMLNHNPPSVPPRSLRETTLCKKQTNPRKKQLSNKQISAGNKPVSPTPTPAPPNPPCLSPHCDLVLPKTI